jgi:hypothetical protein
MPDDGGAPIEAIADAPVDASMLLEGLPQCFGSFIQVCVDMPTSEPTLPTLINTNSSPLCMPYTSTPAIDACVIAGTAINIGGTDKVQAVGTRPLIFVSTGDIKIAAMAQLDVASHRMTNTIGPGGDSSACPTSQRNASNFFSNSGGGWGGSFGGAGGNGGNGGGGGIGGGAAPATGASTLRGGCRGGSGASDFSNAPGGRGHGGGAVLIISLTKITIDGALNASGSAGGGGGGSFLGQTTGGGGGGGGSGGMIVFDAPIVGVAGGARVFANGAGGGEGASNIADGRSGVESNGPTNVGTGGLNGSVLGGDGAAGAANGIVSGSNASNGGGSGGGGGGGGAAGVIKVFSAAPTGTTNATAVSPLPT